jgi:hypothetical protein
LKLSDIDVILYFGSKSNEWKPIGLLPLTETGASQMNELSIFISMVIVAILWALVAYSIGYRKGHYDGYNRGKSVARHASSKAVI